MRYHDRTSIGGARSDFLTTQWTVIQAAGTDDEDRRNAIVGNLMTGYWKPVYCYLRRRGYDNDQAKDLTQGFFCEIVLARGLVPKADRDKGRFRTFLLTALDRYVVSVYRHETRKEARPKGGVIELSPEELMSLEVLETTYTPDHAFDSRWAADLLEEVLSEVRKEYCSTGRHAHWELFRQRVLTPDLRGCGGPCHCLNCVLVWASRVNRRPRT